MQGAIGDLFRDYLRDHGFLEIHSPKLQGAATESGASVFKVSYFKGTLRLAFSVYFASLTFSAISRRCFPRSISSAREADGNRR